MREYGARPVRILVLAAALGFLGVALVLRAFTGDGLGGGQVAQYSGTALYGSMVYAGVLFLWPRVRPTRAGIIATVFCWVVETAQVTGIPAELSARSLVARVVLGVQFDWTDMLWYPVGIVPLVAIDGLWNRRGARRSAMAPIPVADCKRIEGGAG